MTLDKLFKTSLQHISRNKGLAFASVVVMTLTFLISSVFGVAFYTATTILDYVDKKIPVIVFVENTATDTQLALLNNTIKSIKPNATIKYNSKDVSYDIYIRSNKNNPSLTIGVTPDTLPAFIEVNVPTQVDALDLYSSLVKTVSDKTDKDFTALKTEKLNYLIYNGSDTYVMKKDYQFIRTISIDRKTSEFFNNLKNFVQLAGIIIAIFLVVVSLIIIFITTGMAIYSNREEIETMELVGATPIYVRLPYIFDGAIFGFIGAFVSTVLLFIFGYIVIKYNAGGVVGFLNKFFDGIQWVDLNLWVQAGLAVFLLAIGSAIGAFASAIATKRYLK